MSAIPCLVSPFNLRCPRPSPAGGTLQPVGLANEVVRQIACEFHGLALIEAMFGDQAREPDAINAAGNIVARRDGEERTRVVVEPHRIVEARSLGDIFAEAEHAFRTVEEPPRRAQAEAGVVSGERSQLTAI